MNTLAIPEKHNPFKPKLHYSVPRQLCGMPVTQRLTEHESGYEIANCPAGVPAGSPRGHFENCFAQNKPFGFLCDLFKVLFKTKLIRQVKNGNAKRS